MAAHNVVRKGIRWREGNGQSIRVWEDKWLPHSSTYKVISPRVLLPSISRVCDLIDVENNCWNGDLLKQVFLPFEAEVISGIPLSTRLLEDRQVWVETTNGLFFVRSVYKVVMDLEANGNEVSCSDSSRLLSFLDKKLWKINVPHKVSVGYISTVYFCDRAKGTIHRSKIK